MTDGANLAFYIGPSEEVGGTKTEMVAWANPDIFLQIWIGVDDKLPRRVRAIYSADPAGLRHQLDLSDWQIDPAIPADAFTSQKAEGAKHIKFDRPENAPPPPGLNPLRITQAVQADAGPFRAQVTMRLSVMKAIVVTLGVLLAGVAWQHPAGAWTSANRYGGSTTHTYGQTSHTNAYGGSTSHAYGQGTEHTNMYGGSSAHAYGGGTEHTNVYGGSTYGAYGAGVAHTYPSGATAYHPPGAYPGYPAYHPPVAVPYYSASGCYGCAAAAGAIVGVAAGVAAASANTAAATANAYSAGVAAGVAAATAAPVGAYVVGTNYAVIPSGCVTPNVGGATYYLCGNNWFQPIYGANGVYYRAVPAP